VTEVPDVPGIGKSVQKGLSPLGASREYFPFFVPREGEKGKGEGKNEFLLLSWREVLIFPLPEQVGIGWESCDKPDPVCLPCSTLFLWKCISTFDRKEEEKSKVISKETQVYLV